MAGWLYTHLADRQLTEQYEQRALAVASTVANVPQVVGALSGTAPRSVVQPIAQRITRASHAAFVVVVDRQGIRLSSPNPALVGKWFHEAVVSLDGRWSVARGCPSSSTCGFPGDSPRASR